VRGRRLKVKTIIIIVVAALVSVLLLSVALTPVRTAFIVDESKPLKKINLGEMK
jgi:hypothetical protein